MPRWLDRWTEKRTAKAQQIIAEAEAAGHPTSLKEALGQGLAGLKDAVEEAGAGIFPPPGNVDALGRDFAHPPPLVDDPSIPAAERAARDAARAPYLAPDATEVTFTRIPTTGKDQLSAVAAALSAFRADRVFGVHRVPDRYEERRRHEDKAYLEWEIVHAPDAGAQAQAAHFAGFKREDAWVARGDGDPSVLDEDMIGTLVTRAALEPADTYGLTRILEVLEESQADGASSVSAYVRGTMAITRRDLLPAQRDLAAAAPLDVGPPPFHVTVLDWEAIAAWNRPKRRYPRRVPAPMPHLPGDPQELLGAHLQVVGVRPEDCYGAMVTRAGDRFMLGDLGPAGISRGFTLPKYPCADGRERSRLCAAGVVVVAYRDSDAYAEGRRRWVAYETDVLHARLASVADDRPPMEERQVVDVTVLNSLNPLGPLSDFPLFPGRSHRELGPYC